MQSVQLFLAVIGIPMIMLSALVEELREPPMNGAPPTRRCVDARPAAILTRRPDRSNSGFLGDDGTIIAANRAWREAAERLARFDEHYVVGVNFLDECERGRPASKRSQRGSGGSLPAS